ncbi:MAG: hypothetical protein ACLFWR_08870 [Acidimicrobiales bacterium]
MSNDQTNQSTSTDGDDDGNADDPAGLRKMIKELRAENTDLHAKVTTFERDKAFNDAGVPADGPAKWFRQAYDGDLTPEAIKAAAEADNIIAPAGNDGGDTTTDTTTDSGDGAGGGNDDAGEGGMSAAEQMAWEQADDVAGTQPSAPPSTSEALAAAASKGNDEINRLMEARGLT